MAKATKQMRLRDVPAEIHKKIKLAAAMADKTLEEFVIDILKKATNGK